MFQAIYAMLRAWFGKQVLDMVTRQVSAIAEQAPSKREVSKQVSSTMKKTAETVEDITSDVSSRVRHSAERLSGQISSTIEKSAEGISERMTDVSERISNVRLLPRRRIKARRISRTNWGFWMRLGLLASLAFWWWLIREQDEENRRAEEMGRVDEGIQPQSRVRTPRVTSTSLREVPTATGGMGRLAETQSAPAQPSLAMASQEETVRSEAEGMSETGTELDDLTRIEGIGPTIAALFRQNGIYTFQDLANADVNHLEGILTGANLRLADPSTWSQQASLAAAGDWDGLQEMQQGLRGGRRIQ